jgi:trans-aconitate 2-methyltransferase
MQWDVSRYLKFKDERLRCGFDLMARIPDPPAGAIYDLGCGTGEHAVALAERWPNRAVIGVDSSAAMVEAAQGKGGHVLFQQGDISSWQPAAPPALIFSNSTLQWLPDHRALIPRWLGFLPSGGILAVQMPTNFDSPAHALMRETAMEEPWREKLAGVLRVNPTLPIDAYYNLVAPRASAPVDLWETNYVNILTGDNPVVDWLMGTGLRPILARLQGSELDGFLASFSAKLAHAYPKQPDGRTLFPQSRLFFVARV